MDAVLHANVSMGKRKLSRNRQSATLEDCLGGCPKSALWTLLLAHVLIPWVQHVDLLLLGSVSGVQNVKLVAGVSQVGPKEFRP